MTKTAPPERVGPWRVLTARQVFENPWIRVSDHDVTHPDGSPGKYGVIRFKHRAIGILPIDDHGNVWLVGQHRFPLDAYSWELPEGGGGIGEDPLAAAKRELAEETGLTAGSWRELASFDVSNSITDENSVCYIAWDISQGASSPDPSEALEIRRAPFAELLGEVLDGRIRDSLTIVMTLTARIRALRGELPESICMAINSDRR